MARTYLGHTQVAANADLDALAGGTASAAWIQSGAGTVARTLSAKLRDVLNLSDFVPSGTTVYTTAINAALTEASARGGAAVWVGPGTYDHETITVPADCALLLAPGAVLNHLTWNENGIVMGAGSLLRGGTIQSPETWDGTNVEWTYAVVYTATDNVTIEDVTLTNVPRVGIGFKNGSSGIVRGCRITGNYPEADWTGVETVHFGIGIDPGGGAQDGLFTITGNIIRSCVQGTFVGNYAVGAGRGIAFTGNAVEGCWNHGIYCATGDGYSITGNSFADCQIAVVVTGSRHVVSGNACYTTGTGSENHVPGISVRDGEGCVVIGNTFNGDAKASSVIISVQEFDGTTCVDNIVAHNTINVTGGSSAAIRVGAGAATTFYGNLVQGNIVRSVGFANLGVIALAGNSGTQGFGNRILDNSVTMLGDSNGIYVSQCVDTLVRANYIRLEYDAPSAKTLRGVFLTGTATRTEVRDNTFVVPATFGDDITFRGIDENFGGGVVNSIYAGNTFSLSLTKLTAAVTHVIQGLSDAFLDERGTGVPAFAVVPGSRWARTDGGANTSLYVKETASSSTTWVGK